MLIHGPILTQCHSLDQVAACIRDGGYTALKVVTGWGSPHGWDREAMTRVARLVPHLVVRTVAGDPSYNGGSHRYPLADQVAVELGPWYSVRPDILIEVGNEPNLFGWSETDAWIYRWHLDRTITACRATFPQAKLIAPAALLEYRCNPYRWLEIVGDVMGRCDYIGVHAYEFDAFLASERRHGTTRQLGMAAAFHKELFPDRPWLLTEYGINDPGTASDVKGRRYAAMLRRGRSTPVLPSQFHGALYYHFCADGSLHPEYHIAPAGDVAYRREWQRI